MKLEIGQIWQDWDIRFRKQTPRFLKIIGFPNDLIVQVENVLTKRKTLITQHRMKPTANGYKFIKNPIWREQM